MSNEEKANEIGKRPWYPVPGFQFISSTHEEHHYPEPGITIKQYLIAEGMKIASTKMLETRAKPDKELIDLGIGFAKIHAEMTLLAMAEAEAEGGAE